MSLTLRCDASPLITGQLVVGDTGHGVLADNVPAGGTHGNSPLYETVSQNALTGVEVRAVVTAPPTEPHVASFFQYEDGSQDWTVTEDGTATVGWDLYVGGAFAGSAIQTLHVGQGTVVLLAASIGVLGGAEVYVIDQIPGGTIAGIVGTEPRINVPTEVTITAATIRQMIGRTVTVTGMAPSVDAPGIGGDLMRSASIALRTPLGRVVL